MLYIKRLSFIVGAAALLTISTTGGSPVHTVHAQNSGAVTDGFNPKTDSFSFENYGNDSGYTNLTAVEVRRMFGDQVCARLSGDKCVLTPPAQQWMDQTNAAMAGGHCDGMATLSSLLYNKKVDISQFGSSEADTLKIDGNQPLQREIAYWWSTQTTSPGNSNDVKGTPADIIKTVNTAIQNKSETYTVGIFQPDGSQGHSITAYGVKDQGNGVYWLMVYDNNYPNQERYIVVDTTANTWYYTTAADPSAAENDYKGDATTQSLTLTPDSARLQPQQCPFCTTTVSVSNKVDFTKRAVEPTSYNEIYLTDAESETSIAHLLITDSSGNQLGYVDDKLVNTIPGARYDQLTSSNLYKSHIEPIYYVPTGVSFTIKIDGSKLPAPDTASVALIGPGYDLAADNIKLQPGESDTMAFSPDGKQLTYTPSAAESPDFTVGLTHIGADYNFEIKGFEVDKGASVNINLEYDKGLLALSSTGNTNPSVYTLYVDRIDNTSESTFDHDGIELNPGDTANIDFGKWDGKTDLKIGIDSKSDGTIDQTIDESNQAK